MQSDVMRIEATVVMSEVFQLRSAKGSRDRVASLARKSRVRVDNPLAICLDVYFLKIPFSMAIVSQMS